MEIEAQTPLETRSAFLLRQSVGEMVILNRELVGLMGRVLAQINGADAGDYALVGRSATGLASWNARCGRRVEESEADWLARVESLRDRMDELQGRTTRAEALEKISATRKSWNKKAADGDRAAAVAQARADGVQITEETG